MTDSDGEEIPLEEHRDVLLIQNDPFDVRTIRLQPDSLNDLIIKGISSEFQFNPKHGIKIIDPHGGATIIIGNGLRAFPPDRQNDAGEVLPFKVESVPRENASAHVGRDVQSRTCLVRASHKDSTDKSFAISPAVRVSDYLVLASKKAFLRNEKLAWDVNKFIVDVGIDEAWYTSVILNASDDLDELNLVLLEIPADSRYKLGSVPCLKIPTYEPHIAAQVFIGAFPQSRLPSDITKVLAQVVVLPPRPSVFSGHISFVEASRFEISSCGDLAGGGILFTKDGAFCGVISTQVSTNLSTATPFTHCVSWINGVLKHGTPPRSGLFFVEN